MTTYEAAALLQRLEAVPKHALASVIIDVTRRIGGTGALVAAIAEAENDQAMRLARRRRGAAARREARA